MRAIWLASCVVCACAEQNAAPKAIALPTPSASAAVVATSFDDCRASIAKRFHPPASWSREWTKGPTDHVPECHPWWDGSPPLAKPVPPEQCPDSRGGWAGIGMSLAEYGWGISEDGSLLARCKDVCTVLRVVGWSRARALATARIDRRQARHPASAEPKALREVRLGIRNERIASRRCVRGFLARAEGRRGDVSLARSKEQPPMSSSVASRAPRSTCFPSRGWSRRTDALSSSARS